jgi:8-oxo-dGTP diphosphatase
MARPFLYCPYDMSVLVPTVVEAEEYASCPKLGCNFIHWDNPVPTVSVLVPMVHSFLIEAGMSTIGVPDGGVLLVQRKNPPFAGGWCLPCGFNKRHSHPKQQAAAEVKEESGIEVMLEQLVCLCNPVPGEVNQTVAHYVGRPVGGSLESGSDAADAWVFGENALPEVCFRSHRKMIRHWFAGELGTLTGKNLVL